eukprot:Nk52_evm1s1057 gene=Nk52_evmTU1s1057
MASEDRMAKLYFKRKEKNEAVLLVVISVILLQGVLFAQAATRTKVDIEEGTYVLYNRKNNEAMSVDQSSKKNRAKIISYPFIKAKSQAWEIRKNGDYYNIINRLSGKALRTQDSSKASGTVFVQHVFDEWRWSQQYHFEDAGNGYVYIFHRHSQRTVRGPLSDKGQEVILWNYEPTYWSEMWKLEKLAPDSETLSCKDVTCPKSQELTPDCQCACKTGVLAGHLPIDSSCNCKDGKVPSADFSKCELISVCPEGTQVNPATGICMCRAGQLQNHPPLAGKCDCDEGKLPHSSWNYCVGSSSSIDENGDDNSSDGGNTDDNTGSSSKGPRKNLLHGTGMEESEPINEYGSSGRGYSIDVQDNAGGARKPHAVTDIVRAGKQSILCYIQKAGWGFRSEIIANGNRYRRYLTTEFEKEYWFGWSLYLPNDYVTDNTGELWSQFHHQKDTDLGEDWRNPTWSFGPMGDNVLVWSKFDDKLITPPSGPNRYGAEYQWIVTSIPAMRGRWTDMVMHVNWSYRRDGPGFFKLWINGDLKLTHHSPNCYNDRAGATFLKAGIYKWPWRGTQSIATDRAVYVDEMYIGNDKATYDDVAPRDD